MNCASETPDWAEYAFVALGSNLGESPAIFKAALPKIQELADGAALCSSWWKSAPVDCPPGSPEFLNALVAFKPLPALTAEQLLLRLQSLEREFGRTPKKALNEPRPLDLDLISFRNEIRNEPHLILPHPRAHQRRFVLQPLVEIAPDFVLPGFGDSARKLLHAFRSNDSLTRVASWFITLALWFR